MELRDHFVTHCVLIPKQPMVVGCRTRTRTREEPVGSWSSVYWTWSNNSQAGPPLDSVGPGRICAHHNNWSLRLVDFTATLVEEAGSDTLEEPSTPRPAAQSCRWRSVRSVHVEDGLTLQEPCTLYLNSTQSATDYCSSLVWDTLYVFVTRWLLLINSDNDTKSTLYHRLRS